LPGDAVIELLDDYFDAIVSPRPGLFKSISVAQPARPDAPLKSGRKRTQWWRERDETLTDIARSYNIKAYGVKEDAALPEDAGTVFVR